MSTGHWLPYVSQTKNIGNTEDGLWARSRIKRRKAKLENSKMQCYSCCSSPRTAKTSRANKTSQPDSSAISTFISGQSFSTNLQVILKSHPCPTCRRKGISYCTWQVCLQQHSNSQISDIGHGNGHGRNGVPTDCRDQRVDNSLDFSQCFRKCSGFNLLQCLNYEMVWRAALWGWAVGRLRVVSL